MMKKFTRLTGNTDLETELEKLGYRELAAIFEQLYPDRDPYEIIRWVVEMLDEQHRVLLQSLH